MGRLPRLGKDVGPRLVEIKLAGPGASSKDIEFKDR
jgi:hypothetical protein